MKVVREIERAQSERSGNKVRIKIQTTEHLRELEKTKG
jgi:hypothetical protein